MLTPWKKSYDQPRQHIIKPRHHLANKVHLVKAMFFPVVMYGCENGTIKKAESQRIDAFELWCWRSLLTVPWTSMRSNQRDPTELRHEIKLLSEQASMVCCLFSSSVQSLSHVRLYATHGLQHARPPVYHKLQEFTQTHVQ